MASYKDTFESKTFASDTFASGAWRGKGVAVAYLSTTGVFTVTNITAARNLNVATATEDDAANLLGTIIYDIQEGLYDGSAYTISGASTDHAFDCDSTTLDEILNVQATVIADNPGTTFLTPGFEPTNEMQDYILDCLTTTLDELADVLATLLLYYGMRVGTATVAVSALGAVVTLAAHGATVGIDLSEASITFAPSHG